MPNQNHPELQTGEFHLGNFTLEMWEQVGWSTKRRGEIAYQKDGNPYPFARQHGVAPGFAQIQENPELAAQIISISNR